MRRLLMILCLLTAHAHAQEPVERYLDVLAFAIEPDNMRGTPDEGSGGRVAGGFHLNGNWFGEIQVFGSILETDVLGGTDYYLNGAGFDVAYAFGGKQQFSPFLLAGIGFAYNDVLPDEYDDTDGFANLALGFTTGDLGPFGLRLRAEFRYVHDLARESFDDRQLGLGVSIPFGRIRERIIEREIIREVPVEVPVEVVVERPAPVPFDTDNDGLNDNYDQCPNTLAGAEIDAYGCMITEQTITLQGVNFEFDSARLTAFAEMTLNGVAASLIEQPLLSIEIAGHTDSSGSDTYNLNLSRARAESVRDYLARRGVTLGRMIARGYGETEPVAANETDAGRAENRRVELRILDEE